ncbi:MAG: hypothetical protein ACXABY_20615, partial [Candidatus Thorarchaeota archaeon]
DKRAEPGTLLATLNRVSQSVTKDSAYQSDRRATILASLNTAIAELNDETVERAQREADSKAESQAS